MYGDRFQVFFKYFLTPSRIKQLTKVVSKLGIGVLCLEYFLQCGRDFSGKNSRGHHIPR